ncbi:hypothetical protein LguiB_028222 [Lonicera macranthoides]
MSKCNPNSIHINRRREAGKKARVLKKILGVSATAPLRLDSAMILRGIDPPKRSSRPKAIDPEGSEALARVSSEWGVAQGFGSPSKPFGDNSQDIFPGITLRIVNEENTSYKPQRHSRKNYTRRYPSRVMTISSPTTSRETHH